MAWRRRCVITAAFSFTVDSPTIFLFHLRWANVSVHVKGNRLVIRNPIRAKALWPWDMCQVVALMTSLLKWSLKWCCYPITVFFTSLFHIDWHLKIKYHFQAAFFSFNGVYVFSWGYIFITKTCLHWCLYVCTYGFWIYLEIR